MTPEQIKAAIADVARKALHVDPPYIETNAQAAAAFDDDHERERQAQAIAAAVMALVGPKPLVWHDESGDSLVAGPYEIWHGNNGHELTYWQIVQGEPHPTLEAAQAAAQAHADAAHWGRMVLADMIGGE